MGKLFIVAVVLCVLGLVNGKRIDTRTGLSPTEDMAYDLVAEIYKVFWRNENFTKDFSETEICLVANSFNVSSFRYLEEEDLKLKLTASCSAKPQIMNCLDDFITSYSKYMQPNETEILDKYFNIIYKNAADYVCADNGKIIITLRNDENINCFKTTNDVIGSCLELIVKKYKHLSFLGIQNLINTNQCADFQDDFSLGKNCFLNNLESCSKDLSTIFGEIMGIYFRAFSCKFDESE